MAETEPTRELQRELTREPMQESVGLSEGAAPDNEEASGVEASGVEASGVEARGVEASGGAEQRNEERYPVLGDAEVFVIGGMSMFRGRVLNISSSGCYVQTIAWAQLPPETTVEVLLVLQGNVVRALAEARYSESRVGLGLRFVSMELAMRRRLDTLLASLPRSAEQAEALAEERGDVGATASAEPSAGSGVGVAS
jgi:PilZ domain